MAESDELERSLALARQVRGPAAMKARVNARLLQAPPTADAPPLRAFGVSAGRGWLEVGRRLLARRLAVGTVALLVGAGFLAGLWIGRQPLASQRDENQREEPAARAENAHPADLGAASVAGAPIVIAHTPDAHVTDAPPDAPTASTPAVATRPDHGIDPSRRPTTTPTRAVATSPAREALTPRHRAAVTRRIGAGSHAPATADDLLAREIALLERVERALRAGEADLALGLLAELDLDVPAAALGQERGAARVLAECLRAATLDRDTLEANAASAGAERFLAANPVSVYADRIRKACPRQAPGENENSRLEEAVRAGH